MAESEEGVIKEGFLCPICHKDMRSPKVLLSHFQENHSEEQDILRSLKGLVGKAKNKILKIDDKDFEIFKTESYSKYYLEKSVPQEVGLTRSHIEYFKEVRRERLDHRTSETNKLIIRLDRFLRSEGTDRRQIAQELVTWLDGSTVSRCPSCTSSFNLTRRQHHCRLCGSIMCNSCSTFLSYESARCIVTAMYSEVAAIKHKDDNETLRICTHCRGMLEYRKQAQMHQSTQPQICKLYEYLQKIKSEIVPNVELYNKIYTSLTSGDTTFQIQDAESLRSSIAKQAEVLDNISKKIAAIPPDSENPKAYTLQTAIRRGSSLYIKDNLLTLPTPPTRTEIEKIKQERIQRNVELPQSSSKVNVQKVTVTTGWSTTDYVPETHDDPLIEQMNIVRNYIKQATAANRFEEAATLRENLKMLQEMFGQQRMAKQEN